MFLSIEKSVRKIHNTPLKQENRFIGYVLFLIIVSLRKHKKQVFVLILG